MAHIKKQVRDVFQTRLAALASIASAHTNRGPDLTDGDLPAAIIQTPDEDAQIATKGSSTTRALYSREVEVAVVIVAEGASDTLDDDLDALQADAEGAIEADEDLGGLAHQSDFIGSDLDMGTDEDGHRWYAFLTLTWRVEIWTEKGDPETAV